MQGYEKAGKLVQVSALLFVIAEHTPRRPCVYYLSQQLFLLTHPSRTCPQGVQVWPDCQIASPSCGSQMAQPAGTLIDRRRDTRKGKMGQKNAENALKHFI